MYMASINKSTSV